MHTAARDVASSRTPDRGPTCCLRRILWNQHGPCALPGQPGCWKLPAVTCVGLPGPHSATCLHKHGPVAWVAQDMADLLRLGRACTRMKIVICAHLLADRGFGP